MGVEQALFRVRHRAQVLLPPSSGDAGVTKRSLTWYHSDPTADVYPKADDGFRSGCRKVARPFFDAVLGLDQVLRYPARYALQLPPLRCYGLMTHRYLSRGSLPIRRT